MMKFLIIANKNAVTYKEVFPFFKNKEIRMGYTIPNEFYIPDGSVSTKLKGLCRWITNLENKACKPLTLSKSYNPLLHERYDNYDAVNVDRIKDIPFDYYGMMGVPITILEYDLKDFDIMGIADRQNTYSLRTKKYSFEDTPDYNDHNPNAVIKRGNEYISKYARVMIKRKKI